MHSGTYIPVLGASRRPGRDVLRCIIMNLLLIMRDYNYENK